MPKQKTHSGAKDRFRVTKTGKVLHRKMNKNHILEKKSSQRKRRLSQEGELTGGDAKKVKRMLKGS
jgi:large subunit ribosomal protein L35